MDRPVEKMHVKGLKEILLRKKVSLKKLIVKHYEPQRSGS